jgi:hypothetical protein
MCILLRNAARNHPMRCDCGPAADEYSALIQLDKQDMPAIEALA